MAHWTLAWWAHCIYVTNVILNGHYSLVAGIVLPTFLQNVFFALASLTPLLCWSQGVSNRASKCTTCGQNLADCTGHFGEHNDQ